MKPGELIDVCIECYKTYTPSKVTLDSHLEVFLAKIDATDEGDVVFIKQVVYGCIRFKKLNKVTLTALYFKHGTQVTCPRRASPRPPLPHSPHYEGSQVAGRRQTAGGPAATNGEEVRTLDRRGGRDWILPGTAMCKRTASGGVCLQEPGGSSWSLAGAVAPVGGRDLMAGVCALLAESD